MRWVIQYNGKPFCTATYDGPETAPALGKEIAAPPDSRVALFVPVDGDEIYAHYSIDESGNLMYAADGKTFVAIPKTEAVIAELAKYAGDADISNDKFVTLLRLQYKPDVTQADIDAAKK